MSQDEDWRHFERLAARIEGVLAPHGAVVRSPDRIPDLLTGSLREVDASIRMTVGSVGILITIECRRRGAVQDDTWIEQLATKKEKLGAARTIAVSASGFSEPAKITAGLKGIDLRNLREIADEEIVSWLRAVVFTKVALHLRPRNTKARLDGDSAAAEHEFGPQTATGGIHSLVRVADGQFVSPYDVLSLVVRSSPNLFREVPLDGRRQLCLFTAELPKGAVKAQTPSGLKSIASMTFEVECWHELTSDTLADGKYYEYAGPDGVILHGAEFKTELEGLLAILGVHVRRAPDEERPE